MLQKFMDEMVKLPDVWFVTNWQAIEWMKKPIPVNQLNQFEPWNCKRQVCIYMGVKIKYNNLY